MTKKKQKDANIRITLEARKRLRIAAISNGISLKDLIDRVSLKTHWLNEAALSKKP